MMRQTVKTCKREPLVIFVHCYTMNYTLVYAIAHDFYLISQLDYQSSFNIRHTNPVLVAVHYLQALATLE
ncbi:hypothetical protein ISN45_Aa05g029400 [Arabidopsis thaliana x Arabidopsis arenosa]|uniref:Uncharacterized protein n=1 Tax=Arabidopsis thaliana x Arabidopsis arenosa TaxID=1240361 RepID=A0A8T1ZTH9_9BRAS|nr:hypothetical protein ISN45_Aa05g029400 [Arabidopsis thaliana x Arabidopsis arenosa]